MNRSDVSAPVARYFDLMDGDDKARVVEVFTPDAEVVDDGHTYAGHDAILGWLTGPASEFTTTSTWLSVEQAERTAVVRIRLEGDFPGGRVDLRYTFATDGAGRISALAITA